MSTVLILYPKLFNCYSKFSRKVEKIISTLDDVTLLCKFDYNNFIKKYNEENSSVKSIICEKTAQEFDKITHFIVFDDGEEFPEEIDKLRTYGKPTRIIHISITRVVNIKTEKQYQSEKSTAYYQYIGRGSYWGNPYCMHGEGDDREEVIRKFKYDFDYEKFPNKDKNEVYSLAGKRLGCFCKPHACHGDVLADFLNSWDDGK